MFFRNFFGYLSKLPSMIAKSPTFRRPRQTSPGGVLSA